MPTGPIEVYGGRRAEFAVRRDERTARWNLLANLRLIAFAATAILAGVTLYQREWILLAPVAVLFAVFLILVIVHRRVGLEMRRFAILHDLNDEGIKRIGREWSALPVRHGFRAPAEHPFAGDLDLFGQASVYHLLETVETPMGQRSLRDRLLLPRTAVEPDQKAVQELAQQLDWRQQLAMQGRLGSANRADPAGFLAWAESDPILPAKPGIVWAARLGAALLIGSAIADILGLIGWPIWVVALVVNLAITQVWGRGLHERIEVVASQHRSLSGYAAILARIDELQPSAELLTYLKAKLQSDGHPAHEQLSRLERLTAWAVPRSSLAYLPFQALVAWDVHVLDGLERWQRVSGKSARVWLDTIGEVESLSALAGLAHDEPEWVFPGLDPSYDRLSAEKLAHPLIPDQIRVANDVTVGPAGSFLLITGSNMSGKSTLLRAIGVNIVLAGAGAPVCARAMTLSPLTLWTSVRVQDSLERGVSFFMAELLRLKQIADAARDRSASGPSLFFLLDEILQGTNTAERQIAARRIIRGLVDRGAYGAVSTHDLTLPDGPELGSIAELAHFRDIVAEGPEGPQMGFDYTLRPGLATSTNALKLMELVGFDFP